LNFELAYAEIPRRRPPTFLSHPVIPRLTIAITPRLAIAITPSLALAITPRLALAIALALTLTIAVTIAVIPSEARKLPPLLPYDGGNGRRFLSSLEMTAQKVEMTAQRWRKGGAMIE
jgi:hypothetical protein